MPRQLLCCVMIWAIVAGAGGCTHRAGQQIASDTMDETVAMPTSASASRGEALFVKNCAACHGVSSAGPIGPWLRGERTRKDLTAVIEIIKHPDPPMPKLFPGTLRAQDVADLAAYVEGL